MDKIGIKIKELRKGVGLSQDEFAKKIGVSRQTVIKWENGAVHPSLQYALKICEEFSVPPSAFLENDSDVIKLLNQAEQQLAITEKKKKAFNFRRLLANVFLVFAFLFLTVIVVTVALYLVNVLSPTDSHESVISVTFSTSPEAITFYVIVGVLTLASLITVIRYLVVKALKSRKS